MSDSDPSAHLHEIPDQVRDDEMVEQAHPAATSHANGAASLAPLPQAGGVGGGLEPPAPKRPPRRHEWTRARMDAFLGELRATQSVSRAARAVGMGRQSAYKLKRRMAGQPFAEAWDEAVADLRLEGPLAPFMGPRACPLCGAPPLGTPGRR